jgi:hypothetical protein
MIRVCVTISLLTAMIEHAAFGAYSGKETGETALFRGMLDSFHKGDIAVFDRMYCTYMALASLLEWEVDVCTRNNASRKIDDKNAKRIGYQDDLVTFTRPARPSWMTQEEYEKILETLELRVVRFQLVCPGFRTETCTLVFFCIVLQKSLYCFIHF